MRDIVLKKIFSKQYLAEPLYEGDGGYRLCLNYGRDLTGCEIMTQVKRSDGTIVTYKGDIEGNYAYCRLEAGAFSVAGECEIRMHIVSASYTVTAIDAEGVVQEKLDGEAVTSDDRYPILTSLVNEVRELKKEYENLDGEIEKKANKNQPGGYAGLDENGKAYENHMPFLEQNDDKYKFNEDYLPEDLARKEDLANKENVTNKNQPGGYAGLDENKKLFYAQLPDAITDAFDTTESCEEIELNVKDGVDVSSESETISAADYATVLIDKGYVAPYLLCGTYNKTKVMIPKASEGGTFNEADENCWFVKLQSCNYYMAKVEVSSLVGNTVKIKGTCINTSCPCAFVVDSEGNILNVYGSDAGTMYGYEFPEDYTQAEWSPSNAIETEIPEGALYLYVSGRRWTSNAVEKLNAVPVIEVEVTSAKKLKEEYLPDGLARNEDLHTHNNKDVLDKITEVPGLQDEVRFVLPPYMYFVVGKRTEIAPFSALRRATANSVDRMIVYTSGGDIAQYAEQVAHITGSAEGIGRNIRFRAYIAGEMKEKYANNRVTAAAAGNGSSVKLLFIGDSLLASHATDADGNNVGSIVTRTLAEDLAEDEITPIFLGTQGTEGYKHEGRSSWSAYSFANFDTVTVGDTTTSNPFRNNGVFDFSYYMSEQGYDDVDVVVFNLGVNDLSERRTSEQLIVDLNTMITSIHAFDASIKVVVTLQNICSDWTTYRNKKAYDGRRDSLHDNIEALIAEYQNREGNGIYLAPVYMAVNTLWDMQHGTYTIENSRNPEVLTVGTDMTHPNYYGYQKTADVYYAVLKYLLSLE